MNVELRAVACKERTMTSAFFLPEDIDRAFKLGVGGDGVGFRQNHTAFHLFAINTAQQNTCVVTSLTLIKHFVEHFDTSCNGGQWFVHQANNMNRVIHFQSTAFDTTGHNSSATFNREDIFNRHHEVFFEITDGFHEECVNSIHQVGNRFVFRSFGIC